jgi:hypothetical protein
MKRIILLILIFGVFCFNLSAQSIQQTYNRTVSGLYTSTPVVIDGEFNESVWQIRGHYNSSTDKFGDTSRVVSRKINTNDPGTVFPNPPPAPPVDYLFSSYTTFAVAWDVNNLYVAISVIDTSVVGAHKPFGDKKAASTYIYITPDNTIRKANTTSISIDNGIEFGMFYNKTIPGVLTLDDITRFEGVTDYSHFGIIEGDYSVYFKPTAIGYRLEASIKWVRLNQGYIDHNTKDYIQMDKSPSNLRALAFDMINNIPNHAGTTRQAKMSWNACCLNNNYKENLNYGTLSLEGPIKCELDGCNSSGFTLTVPSEMISGSTPVQISPVWINANYTASINFSVVGAQLASVDATGKIIPFGNGVLTIVATSSDTSLHDQQMLVLTITNVFNLDAITLQVNNINTPFGGAASTIFTYPSTIPNSAMFLLDPPTNLAVINSITGVVTATGAGNGNVRVKAISLLDTSKSATRLITITNQDPPKSIYLMAHIDSIANCSSSPYNVTISGGSGEAIRFSAYYCNSSNVITTIPSQFISYKLSSITGISGIVNGSSRISNPASTATVTGTYIYNSTITAPLAIVLKRGVSLNCYYDFSIAAQLINCGDTLGIFNDEISTNSITVYPNPNEGIFNVNNGSNAKLNFTIINLLGNVLISGELQTGVNPISFKVQSGIYFLRAGQKTIKIYVE